MWGCYSAAVVVISWTNHSAAEDRGELGLEDLERHLPLVLQVLGQIHPGQPPWLSPRSIR
jgi:hypothetical protein